MSTDVDRSRHVVLMAMNTFRVGTSGYSYFWNKGKPTPFEWYCNQGFPTVEVNARNQFLIRLGMGNR